MATEQWRQFEKRILHDVTALKGAITQIPSHMNQSKGRVFRKKTDCDFACGISGRAAFFDAKVCADKRFNVNSLVLREAKVHQYRFLLGAMEKGSQAGYLIWFYNEGKISWLPVENVRHIETAVAWDETFVRSQADDTPIDLKRLIWGGEW